MRSSILRITPVSVLVIVVVFVSTYIWKHNIRLSSCISYLVLILFTTVILRKSTGLHEVNFEVLWSYREFMKGYRPDLFCEIAANVIMLIPLGGLLASLFVRNRILVSITLCSIFVMIIEVLQLVFQRGLCEIDDVISGIIGAGIGGLLFLFCDWIRKRVKLNAK